MADKSAAFVEKRRILFDLSRSGSQLLTVETVRMAFLSIVLIITIIYQIVNSSFISFDVFFSVYMLLAVSFLLNCLYILSLDKILKSWFWTALLFVWETFYVSVLIYFIGISQSLLVFLYLINIILCGVVFQRKGGIYLALLTSIAFSMLLALDKNIQGNTLYLSVGVNNLAFFTVAYLAGYLSEQLNFMGGELIERGRDIRFLKNLNNLVINNMDSGLMTVDNDGVILQQNNKALEILSSGDISGQSLQMAVPDMSNLLKTEAGSVHEVSRKQERGDQILRARVSALNDEAGNKKGSIVVFEDVTHLKKLESRVFQSEKMAAIGQLAAGIAHEIRNPLASISGSIQLLQDDKNKSAEDQKLMGIVIKEIDRLNKLITEFLDYARPNTPANNVVNLSELIKEIIDAIKMDKNYQAITFKTHIDPEALINGQSDKIKQAIWNIVVNGLQAMESSSQKVLDTQVLVQGSNVVVKIKDTGSGIPAQNLKKIFEPFHTTKPKGTGLGLAIVHSILESHKAQIEVRSQVGDGSEFQITFLKSSAT